MPTIREIGANMGLEMQILKRASEILGLDEVSLDSHVDDAAARKMYESLEPQERAVLTIETYKAVRDIRERIASLERLVMAMGKIG